jgi:hypothetical protein
VNFPSRRPSPALIISIIALVVALGGTAFAAIKIGSKQIRNHSVRGKDVKKDTLTGTNIDESSLELASPAPSSPTIGRSAQQTGACDPETTTFVNCVTVTLTLPRAGRVLLVGDGVAEDQGVPGSEGACRFAADGTVVQGSTISVYASAPPDSEDFSATAVTSPLGAGQHVLKLACNQVSPEGIVFEDTQISAVAIDAG